MDDMGPVTDKLTVLHAVVTAEYEDQRTLCLFADEADAIAYAATVNADHFGGYEVQPFVVYPPGRQPQRHTYWHGHSTGLATPRVYSRTEWEYQYELMEPPPTEPVVTVNRETVVNIRSLAEVTTVRVIGADEASVRAALDDTLAKLTEAGDPLYLPIFPAPAS